MRWRHSLSHLINVAKASHLAFRPGDYYSPICDTRELKSRYRDPSPRGDVDLPGIELNRAAQLETLSSWDAMIQPFPEYLAPPARYYWKQSHFGLGDAHVLSCFIRSLKPRRIIEIGSGFSSACALDTIDDAGLQVECTFIDPEPERLLSTLSDLDRELLRIVPRCVQDVALSLFDALEANDILFIDSTHVLKTCSDVAFELFEILPRLKPGVMIHFHDILYPFEYPPTWAISNNFSWNETYAVRCFLSNNDAYQITFWSDYIAKTAGPDVTRRYPWLTPNACGSLWITKEGRRA
jgi:predicted O-methyltransferase YrrM